MTETKTLKIHFVSLEERTVFQKQLIHKLTKQPKKV